MAITAEDFYRSSNGDRWQLIRDTASLRSFVRHEPNLSSGGRTTDTDVDEFLNRTGSSPENLALRALLDKQPQAPNSGCPRVFALLRAERLPPIAVRFRKLGAE